MHDDNFDEWLRDQAISYNKPPAPDVERMWANIDTTLHASATGADRAERAPWWAASWMKLAAALLIGVGLGRVSTFGPSVTRAGVVRADIAANMVPTNQLMDEPTTARYLGQTVALLASLQSERRSTRGDSLFKARTTDLLLTTRLLLDSPSARDPNVRALLDDLELVLAQIVQMPSSRNAADLDLIHQAMEQRDVMPRLRTAVANNISSD